MKKLFYLLFVAILFIQCQPKDGIRLRKGMTISKSAIIARQIFEINGSPTIDEPVLIIEGNDIEIDFNGAILQGSNDRKAPEKLYGLGILVKGGQNIIIKNLTVRGYKCGLLGIGVDSLKLINCDFSYNYRQKLMSPSAKENQSGRLYWLNNKNDEWLQYGAAVYLKECNHALVKNLKVTEGMNGLMLVECNDGLFYNNTILFNTGVGIGMYRSSNNRVLHNKLDWNVRGSSSSHGERGKQSTAAILVYKSSNKNVFAYNSATHSSHGLLILANKDFIKKRKGECNDNLIYGNDFSYASNHAINVNFSSNKIFSNILNDSYTGIMAESSYNSQIMCNYINDNDLGIVFINGYDNNIRYNEFKNNKIGISLGTRKIGVETSNQNYSIDHNSFQNISEVLKLGNTKQVNIILNQFSNCEKVLVETAPNENIINKSNKINPASIFPMNTREVMAYAPLAIPDGMNATLSGKLPRGRPYILMNEYGPYSFRYPKLWLRSKKDDEYIFALFGPYGNWKLKNAAGIDRISLKTGSTPATIVVNKSKNEKTIKIEMEFIGEAIETQFGKKLKKGTPFQFEWVE